MKIFLDTGAWLALEISNDRHHQQAKKHLQELIEKRAALFTNEYVLVETYTRLIYDIHLEAAQKFHTSILKGLTKNLSLFEIDTAAREQTWEALKKYRDHRLSFTDASIIINFKTYQLDEIFTFDKHFRELNLPTNEF